jgi:hypothetical protein
MFRVILMCDVCDREIARTDPSKTQPSPYMRSPPGILSIGAGVTIGDADGAPKVLANIGDHACSKTCARALISKLLSAVEDSAAKP